MAIRCRAYIGNTPTLTIHKDKLILMNAPQLL